MNEHQTGVQLAAVSWHPFPSSGAKPADFGNFEDMRSRFEFLERGNATVRTVSNKLIVGKDSESRSIGAGILVKDVDNVIICNLKIDSIR
jgi:pectate lyase